MKPCLVIGHVPLDIAKLTCLEFLLYVVPSCIENKAVGMKVRIWIMIFRWSSCLMDEFSPKEFPCFSFIILPFFPTTSTDIFYNFNHSSTNGFLENVHDMFVLRKSMDKGHGFWAMKVNIIADTAHIFS